MRKQKNQRMNQDPSGPGIAILATASTVLDRELARSLEEMIFETSEAALAAAGLAYDDLDSVVLSGQDEIDGRVISCMTSAGPAGGVDRDTTMIASSADHALIYGYLRMLAGQSRNVLVVGWAKPSESVDPDRAELMSAEPYLLRQIGMNDTLAAALQASRWASDADGSDGAAWPLNQDDLPARGDSVYAIVLAFGDDLGGRTPKAWILDAGWATLTYELGGRDLGELESLRLAVAQIEERSPATKRAGWNAVEIAAPSQPAVQAVIRQLGLQASTKVNPSGALHELRTSPHVAGLARMVAAIDDLEHGDASVTAAVGFQGFASQGASVMVFSAERSAA